MLEEQKNDYWTDWLNTEMPLGGVMKNILWQNILNECIIVILRSLEYKVLII